MPSKTETEQPDKIHNRTALGNILVFHKLTNRLTYGSTNYSPSRLFKMLERIQDDGYQFVSLGNAVANPGRRDIAITFDDGYAHLIDTLPPLMEKFDFKPTVFVPTAFMGKNNSWDYSSVINSERHLNRSEIRELVALGVEFGSHSHNHVDLTGCDSSRLRYELLTSKEVLEEVTYTGITSISYPFGRINSKVANMAKEMGYQTGFTMSFPAATDSSFTLGRVAVYFFDSYSTVKQKLTGGSARALHRSVGRFINGLSYGTVIFNRLTGRTKR